MRHDPARRRVTGAVSALLLLAPPALAQVGHDPAHSPYETLRFDQFFGLTGGYFSGSGGAVGVAPHDGMILGLRYDFLASGTVSVVLAASYANLERLVVDPHKPIAKAVSGPIKQPTGIGEAIIQFNVTGGKTWHRLAPFVSAGLGFVLAANTPQDTSGFKFRTRLALTPGLGTRIFLGERVFLRVEARSAFWSVSYPATYRQTPSTDITKPPVLLAPAKEWLANRWFSVGLSYAFTRFF